MEVKGFPSSIEGFPVICYSVESGGTIRATARGSTTGNSYTYQVYREFYGSLLPVGTIGRTNSNPLINYTCLDSSDFVYRPEIEIYFGFISFVIIGFAFVLLYRLIIRRLLP